MQEQQQTQTASPWGQDYVAVIADMVGSREILPADRAEVQERFAALVARLNERFRDQLRAKCVITLGDEFQAIFEDASALPDLLLTVEDLFRDRPLRVGVGLGPITTSIPEYAINVDGPALHQARRATDEAKKSGRMGGVFSGFGAREDVILNGLARLLGSVRERWTDPVRRTVALLKTPMSQVDAAQMLGVTKQAVGDTLKRGLWETYLEGEAALAAMLRPYAALPSPGRDDDAAE